MALADRTSIGRWGMAAIVAAAFAVASPGPAWGQDAGDAAEGPAAPETEATAPGGMQMMMGDGGDSAALIGHGFLLDKGVFTTIDHPDAVAETGALGTDNRGQIVGAYTDAEGTIRGFLLDDGAFTPIDHPDAGAGPGTGTQALGLNDRGQIVGAYLDAEGGIHAFLRDKGRGAQRGEGVFTTIDHPDGAGRSIAFGINDRGRIVGAYNAGGRDLGFVRDKGRGDRRDEGVFTTIDFPGAAKTLAQAINNRDQIVGSYLDSEGTMHGFLLDDDEFTTIDHPDAASGIVNGTPAGTLLFGINNRGLIVGLYLDTDLRCHGLLLSRGAFTTIDDPDALSHTGAGDINDRGQIVGFYDGGTGLAACFPRAAGTTASDPGSTAE